MDQVKKLPHPWIMPGLAPEVKLPNLRLPESPIEFKDLVVEQIRLRYSISIEELRSRWRPSHLAYGRQIFSYIMKDSYGEKVTLNWLANILDIADHSSIIHHLRNFKGMLDVNDRMDGKVQARIQGEQFETVTEDYNHFKLILYKCLRPDIISSVLVATSAQEKTP